eukprot:UN15098
MFWHEANNSPFIHQQINRAVLRKKETKQPILNDVHSSVLAQTEENNSLFTYAYSFFVFFCFYGS